MLQVSKVQSGCFTTTCLLQHFLSAHLSRHGRLIEAHDIRQSLAHRGLHPTVSYYQQMQHNT